MQVPPIFQWPGLLIFVGLGVFRGSFVALYRLLDVDVSGRLGDKDCYVIRVGQYWDVPHTLSDPKRW